MPNDKVSAIICSDLHLTLHTPECRCDNFVDTQKRKYKWLRELQQKYNCPVLCAGDIFHKWKPSPELISFALENLPDDMICIAGQHDLEAHNMNNVERSGLYTLAVAGKIQLMLKPFYWVQKFGMKYEVTGFPWNIELKKAEERRGEPHQKYPKVALIHHLVYKEIEPFPGAENVGGTAKSVIKKMQGFDLIVSGDNHQTFTCRVGNQLLVNPGSFMRTTAAQADHKPCVFLWYADTNEVEQVFIPIEKGVISREHIEKVEERDERLEAFISKLNHDVEISISYQKNMREYLAKNTKDIPKNVANIIWRSLA